MTDLLAETPDLSVKYCPGCEPERDPLVGIVIEWRCAQHRPGVSGLEDARATVEGIGQGLGAEAHGANCRAAAEIIRERT